MSTLLRNVPYVAALALAIFGVAYNNFSDHAINGYWEFSRQRYKSQQFFIWIQSNPLKTPDPDELLTEMSDFNDL